MEYASKEQMEEIDRIAPKKYGLTISRMMENAAYHIADYIRQNFDQDQTITVYAGKGNNGGDALAAARRLHNWGFEVKLRIESELDGIRKEEFEILRKLGIEPVSEVENSDVVLDGMIGYNLDGEPRTPFDSMIREINKLETYVVSIDVPSGFDLDNGEFLDPSVTPDAVLTLAAPFQGLKHLDIDHQLIDISIPAEVYTEADVEIDPSKVFAHSSRVKLV